MATVSPSEIEDYDKNPAPVSKLLDDALELTKRHLGYTYGSADPERGGMDCSGFIYYVLRETGWKMCHGMRASNTSGCARRGIFARS